MTDAAHPNCKLIDWPPQALATQLAGPGLMLDLGLVRMRLRSDEPQLAGPLAQAYRHFLPLTGGWCDLHPSLLRATGVRRWIRPQVRFVSDSTLAFDPFPADHALPLLEWGVNWLVSRRMNDGLLLHAGTLERDGHALVMPALPGSGKSTLSAALSLRGWRLLSDEFGAYDPAKGAFRSLLKPVALKNQSIDVIRAFEPSAELGPSFDKTRKGTVAHLAPSLDSVLRRHEWAVPGMLVLPRWQEGSETVLERIAPQVAFTSLAFNAFNYAVLGADGFRAVTALTRSLSAWRLVYSDLDDATAKLATLWNSEVRPGDAGLPPAAVSTPTQETSDTTWRA